MNRLLAKATLKIARTLALDKRIPDETYLKLMFKAQMGSDLHLDKPITFNEKLNWLKIHDRNPLYTTLVDKYRVKQWVADRIGEQYVTPTYAIWERAEDIDISILPERFVLKSNHDSGGVVICTNKKAFDLEAARKKLDASLKRNYYWQCREWPYKDVKPLVFAEEYLEDSAADELPDYKYFCFNGAVKAMFIDTDRFGEKETKFDFFDMEFKHLPITNGHPDSTVTLDMPAHFEEMRALAEKLSTGVPHVRVDFYEADGGIFFGELTFSHWGGFVAFESNEWDEVFKSWIDLPAMRGGMLLNDNWAICVHESGFRVLDEKHLSNSKDITDYKVFCFGNGRKITLACENRSLGNAMSQTFFDETWQMLDLEEGGHPINTMLARPKRFDEMLSLAEKLSEGMTFVRVDFYETLGSFRVGEITFYPNAGYERFFPECWDSIFGSWMPFPGNLIENKQ